MQGKPPLMVPSWLYWIDCRYVRLKKECVRVSEIEREREIEKGEDCKKRRV